ncbi:MAG TPA: GntR family transcriptional regulator [Ignavibacteriaceae bacterium]|nr:GntR family transcriptional regulator [Ignavibacteriaceae bacterium]
MSDEINFNDPTPLYEQIEKSIKRKIEIGDLLPGDPIGSQNDLSKEFKVSVITVKKALSDLVNEGILFTRVGKGTYVADKTQKRIGITKQKTIGLVLRDIKHPFFSMVVHGIEERAYELGYNIMLSSSSNKIEKEESQINHFKEIGVDGLIIASLSLEYRATDYIQKIHNENFPYIMVSYMHDPDYWYVGSDQEIGGFIATEHLIKTGYKSIGYVHIGKGNLLSEVRKNGYYRALTEYNIPYDSKLIFFLGSENFDSGSDRFQLGYEFGKTFKSLEKKPDALFIYSDLTALGFEQAALEAGISIPDEVAIVGFDDLEMARYASIPLTTVNQSAEKIGRRAVEIIEKRINGNDIGNRTILKPSLIIRESCGAKKRAAGGFIKPLEATI